MQYLNIDEAYINRQISMGGSIDAKIAAARLYQKEMSKVDALYNLRNWLNHKPWPIRVLGKWILRGWFKQIQPTHLTIDGKVTYQYPQVEL